MAETEGDKIHTNNSSEQDFDHMFKILIIGNTAVGKTSLLLRYTEDSFTSAFVNTVGIDFKVRTVSHNGKTIKLHMWDTAGQERYRSITTAYYRAAMGFLITYDVTDEQSFLAVTEWAGHVNTYAWEQTQVVLVANKCDMEEDRIVTYEQGKRLADQLGYGFFETSAKNGYQVKEAFDELVDVICEHLEDHNQNISDITAKQKNQRIPQSKSCAC